jgi:hypothetical protein
LELLSGEIEPSVIVILSDTNMRGWTACSCSARSSSAFPICRS